MRPKKDPLRYKLDGQKFGMLTAVKFPAPPKEGSTKRRWECLCDCGETVYAMSEALRIGDAWACPKCKLKAISDKLLGVEKAYENMRTPRLSDS